MQNYEASWDKNRQNIDRLRREFAEIAEPETGSDPKHLEEIIVSIHEIRAQVDSLHRQYDEDAA